MQVGRQGRALPVREGGDADSWEWRQQGVHAGVERK